MTSSLQTATSNNTSQPQGTQGSTAAGRRLSALTFLALHELADGLHEVFLRLHLVGRRDHSFAVLQVVLVRVEPHLLLVLQRPRVAAEAVVPQDGAHAAAKGTSQTVASSVDEDYPCETCEPLHLH